MLQKLQLVHFISVRKPCLNSFVGLANVKKVHIFFGPVYIDVLKEWFIGLAPRLETDQETRLAQYRNHILEKCQQDVNRGQPLLTIHNLVIAICAGFYDERLKTVERLPMPSFTCLDELPDIIQ